MLKTFVPTQNQIERKCFLIDADGKVLGRLATRIARILMGKDEPFYTPHLECGDRVIVINCEKIHVTGRKAKVKMYQNYSGYQGGLKEVPYEKMIELNPERIINDAVRRMIPKNKMRDKMMKRLRVFKGNQHPHQAQQPIALTLED